jgi:hypothetical protein
MAREPSAAEALYGHLRSQLPERPLQRPSDVSIANAMFPKLAPKPPPLPDDPYLRHMRSMGLVYTRQARGR